MVKMIRIDFINHHDLATECSTFYRIKATTNKQAIIDAINLFTEQCEQNNKNFEIIGAYIDND